MERAALECDWDHWRERRQTSESIQSPNADAKADGSVIKHRAALVEECRTSLECSWLRGPFLPLYLRLRGISQSFLRACGASVSLVLGRKTQGNQRYKFGNPWMPPITQWLSRHKLNIDRSATAPGWHIWEEAIWPSSMSGRCTAKTPLTR